MLLPFASPVKWSIDQGIDQKYIRLLSRNVQWFYWPVQGCVEEREEARVTGRRLAKFGDWVIVRGEDRGRGKACRRGSRQVWMWWTLITILMRSRRSAVHDSTHRESPESNLLWRACKEMCPSKSDRERERERVRMKNDKRWLTLTSSSYQKMSLSS